MLETVILSNLISDEEYCRAVLQHLKDDYFSGPDKTTFKIITSFFGKYNSMPTKEALQIELSRVDNLNEKDYKETVEYIKSLDHDRDTDRKFLIDETEKFCQEKALINALRKAIGVIDEPEKANKGSIPKMLQDALAVSFDTSIGHDFFDDARKRYEDYHTEKKRLRFDIDLLNIITKGGVLPKTLFLIMAGTGVGKSLAMCHFAASHLMLGKNVLYFTMEMSEFQIAQRIDHNLLKIPEDDLMKLDEEAYSRRLAFIKDRCKGKLIVKEFPSGSASSAHFRYVIEELRMKKNFVPDVIFVDYLNICASSRVKRGGPGGSFEYIKNIAEEIRGLGQEFNIPVFSATQVNRDGLNSSEIDMTNMSESIGMSFTADYIVTLISSEELEGLGQIVIKQLKNRYGDPTKFKKFVVGIDRSRMCLFNVEQEAQEDLVDEPIMDRTNFGEQENERAKGHGGTSKKSRFTGFR